MVAIPLLSGVAATGQADFVTTRPLNLEPLAIDTKISAGQLRATAGAEMLATGPGVDRGGIEWNGKCYRVMGTKLVRVDVNGTVTELGDVGGTGPVRLDYSFDRLGIRSGVNLYYFDGVTLTQVTDVDLGQVVDAMWIDGYWMTTDGESIVVTELADPTSIDPLKYGSAEEDPDMVTGLMKLREEAYIFGRHTIQVFRNVGGNGFPFANLKGAAIPVGCISATAKCKFARSFAFVGSARGEALSVYVGGQGAAEMISTREVDEAIAATEDQRGIVLEARVYGNEHRLFVHLAEESWIYLAKASQMVGEPVWYRARSGNGRPYRIRNAVEVYGRIMVGDTQTGALGWLTEDLTSHFGETTEWGFDVGLVYNEGRGGLVHAVELVGLPGRVPPEESATIFMSMTRDGQRYSVERAISMGRAGERRKRLQWRPHTRFTNYLGLRFRGYNRAMPGFARCEADLRPLGA